MNARSQESEWLFICVLGVSILPQFQEWILEWFRLCGIFLFFVFITNKVLKKEDIDKGRQLKSHNQVNLSKICTGDICGTKNHTIESIIKQIYR